MSKTGELDEPANWILTDIASGSAKAVDELLADLARAYPDEKRLEFVRRSVGDILRECDAACRVEIEAKRTASTLQIKEAVEERENLRRQVAVLRAQLDSIIEQQKEQQEREREVAWIEERWEALKRSAKIANRTFWLALALFSVALVGDLWAFFIVHGDNYLRLARDTAIGICILATVSGPFLIRAAWKDISATESTLEKFVRWQKQTSGL